MQVGDFSIQEGDWISLDGATGEVFLDQLSTEIPDFNNPYLLRILEWADEIRILQVWTNADYPRDAERGPPIRSPGDWPVPNRAYVF